MLSPKHVLVFWTKSKKLSILKEESFVKAFGENGKEIPISEGAVRTALIGEKRVEGKILRICSSKKYLESLLVTKEGTILLHGTKPPSKECLAKKSKLQDEENESQDKEKQILRPISSNLADQPFVDTSSHGSKCNHGCPTCCSGSMPQFPKLPDGFLSTLVSMAEYFQNVQKASEDNFLASAPLEMSQHLNTWQWASREKVELKKGAGVWMDAIKLEKILGQAQITKKPPHQTLVKSLLTHLLGIDKYIDTTAEKIDRRLLSAVVGFANAKYPELAQPIERYYRCINLNRGYLMKRKNEGALDSAYGDDIIEGNNRSAGRRMETVRQYRKHSLEDSLSGADEPRSRRPRVRVVSREQNPAPENNSVNNFGDSDQIIIPLDPQDSDDCLVVPDNSIMIVHSEFSPQNSNNIQNKLPSQNSSAIQNKLPLQNPNSIQNRFPPQNYNTNQNRFPPQNATNIQNKFPPQNSTNIQNKVPLQNSNNIQNRLNTQNSNNFQNRFPPQNSNGIQNKLSPQNPNLQNKFVPLHGSNIRSSDSNPSSQISLGNAAINEHAYFRISSGSLSEHNGSYSNNQPLNEDSDSTEDALSLPF